MNIQIMFSVFSMWFGIAIAVAFVLSLAAVQEADGHGVGYELLPPAWLGDRQVSLEVSSSRYDDVDNPDRQIRFALMDSKSLITVQDITYEISAYKGDLHLFDGEFVTEDGILVFSFEYEDTDVVTKTKKTGDFFSNLLGTDEKTISVLGRHFESGGLYKFDVKLLTANISPNDPNSTIKYNIGISIPEKTQWYVDDPNFGQGRIDVITYYDIISNFMYKPESKTILFSMPFDWNVDDIKEISVVHEEFSFSKSFGDLLVADYIVKINGKTMPEMTATIDDFSGKDRIVHIIINQNMLLELEESLRGENIMDFEISPANETVLSTITENGQFRVDLWWELENNETVFYFQLKDVFLKDKPVAIEYRFSLVHEDAEIIVQEGTSLDHEPSSVRVEISNEITSPIFVQFENLDDKMLAHAEFPIIINKIVLVPQWVKQTSGWWHEGIISDEEFIASIEYLVRNEIISVSADKSETKSSSVPIWVKQTSGWWHEGIISDEEFIASIEYLISIGIITIEY